MGSNLSKKGGDELDSRIVQESKKEIKMGVNWFEPITENEEEEG